MSLSSSLHLFLLCTERAQVISNHRASYEALEPLLIIIIDISSNEEPIPASYDRFDRSKPVHEVPPWKLCLLSSYWGANQIFLNAFFVVILPSQVYHLVKDSKKGIYLGITILLGAIGAIAAPFIGVHSLFDNNTIRTKDIL